MLTQDRDEELVLFLEMRRREKGSGHNNSNTTTMSSQRPRRTAADNFLYSENEKSDYDWLVTPPGSPSQRLMDQPNAPDPNPMALKSRLGNFQEEERDKLSSNNQTMSSGTNSSVSAIRRPSSSSSSRSTSRPSTPSRRSMAAAKRASTPTSRANSTAARVTLTSSSTTSNSRLTSRPSTPTRRPSSSGTSRDILTAARATTSAPRQTTGPATTTRSDNRPMSAPNTKPGSRLSTPTRRPSTPTGSSTVSKSKPIKPASKPALSQGASPIVRSRPWEPYEMPGFSQEAPSNLRTTLPDRPQSASSRRTRAFGGASSSSRSASREPDVARRQSCSPSRNRAPIGNANGAVPSLRGRRAKTRNDDGGLINHVAVGNQMVEREVGMRKIAPPRLTESSGRRVGCGGSSAGKSSFVSDGFGFGRNLSKSSMDMALRHMDVKRGSMTGNFRPKVTKVPASSVYSVRSGGSRRNRPASSSGSSESSVNILCLDGSDDNLSQRSYP